MPSRPLTVFIGVLIGGAGAAGLGVLTLEHVQLKKRLARRQEWTQMTERMKADNRQLTGLLAQTQSDEVASTQAIHESLAQAKREAADLERQARERRGAMVTQAARDAEALANNRDPQRGLTRPEYFTDVGQATPAAAFQTLGWATLHQPERVASLLMLTPAARTKAEALIATLPEETRVKWTPEKLAELWMTGALTSASAFQIGNVSMDGGNRATLALRVMPNPRQEPKLQMELGPNGWRVVIDERGIDVVRKQMSQTNR